MGVLGTSTLIEGAVDVLVVLIALELLSLGPAGVGWLNSAWGVGGVLGAAGAVLWLTRGRNATALALASLLVGVPLLLLSAVPTTAVAVTGLVVLASATPSSRSRGSRSSSGWRRMPCSHVPSASSRGPTG